jgi:hypothetical protein
MNSPLSPVRARSGYTGTPQHLKTLDILGKSKNFAKLSKKDLILYCELVRSKFGCDTPSDACVFLEDRYGWDVNSRAFEIEEAWHHIETDDVGDTTSQYAAERMTAHKEAKEGPTTSLPVSDIPVILKSGAFGRPVMICEVDDDELHFTGDSGAVGRIFCEPQALRLDIKGRQYSGQLTRGPTLMVLNLAAPVGQSGGAGLCARAEVITNEFCHLEFERDLHSSMQGVYTGNEGDEELMQRDSDAESGSNAGITKKTKACAKRGKGGTDDASQPKISTITQRKRKSKGSSSSGKKGSAVKKSKK